MNEQEKSVEDPVKSPEGIEVTELDDQDLEGVAGGDAEIVAGEDGNCGCSPGRPVPAGTWQNGNCNC